MIFICSTISAQQKGDYIWLFGNYDGDTPDVRGYTFDFNMGDDDYLYTRRNGIGMGSANASISDEQGRLLFYFNGCYVMNRQAEIMENGDSLNYDEFIDRFLAGDCKRDYPSFQGTLILPDNYEDSIFHIFHKAIIFNGFNLKDSIQLWHSKVDMRYNDGLGKVIMKNDVVDHDNLHLKAYFTGIAHDNQKDWWMIQPVANDSAFCIYLLDDEGVSLYDKVNSHWYFERGKSSSSGTAKISPDGTKYAYYNETDGLLLYDFDRSNGNLDFDQRIVPFDTSGYGIFCSVEWSPNSRFLYTATESKLHQIDTWEEDIQRDGIRLIDIYNGTQDPFSTTFFLMAQAPDCKIYMCPTSGTNSYHVIYNPDELGKACNFVQNGLKLPLPSNFGSMPNFPRFRVDEEDKCDPTITSIFGDAVYYRRDLTVYPNPSKGRYTIKLPEDVPSGLIIITDINGQSIKKISLDRGTLMQSIDISPFPKGYYNIEFYPKYNPERIFYGQQVVKI